MLVNKERRGYMFKIDPVQVMEINKSLPSYCSVVSSVRTGVKLLQSQIIPSIKNRKNISRDLSNVYKIISDVDSRIKQLYDTINTISQKYIENEKRISGLIVSDVIIKSRELEQHRMNVFRYERNRDLFILAADDNVKNEEIANDLEDEKEQEIKYKGVIEKLDDVQAFLAWGFKADNLVDGLDKLNDLREFFFGRDINFSKFKDLDVIKFMKYYGIAEKLCNGVERKNWEDVDEAVQSILTEGLVKPVLENTYNTSGFTATSYITLGKNVFENMMDGLEKYGGTKSGITGFSSYLWYVTGWSVLETGIERGYKIVKDIGGIFGYDLDKTYIDLSGEKGVEGFVKASKQLLDEMYGDYYDGTIKGVITGTGRIIGDSVSWWGKKISNLFSK